MTRSLAVPLVLAAVSLAACAGAPKTTAPTTIAGAASAPAPTPGYDWFFDADGGEPRLTYGVEASDDVPVGLSCRPGADTFDVIATGPQGAREIHLESGGDTERLPASAEPSPSTGVAFLTATASAKSPVFQRFRRVGWMAVWHGDVRTMMAPQPGSAARIARFFAACD